MVFAASYSYFKQSLKQLYNSIVYAYCTYNGVVQLSRMGIIAKYFNDDQEEKLYFNSVKEVNYEVKRPYFSTLKKRRYFEVYIKLGPT